jgi:O-antigen ligase
MAGLAFFYYKYVPLVRSYQIPLVIILSLVLLSTLWNIECGLLAFIFIFPLINNLPYFFGIDESIPHAPTALVLFLFFLLGWLMHHSFSEAKFVFYPLLSRPLFLLFLIIIISGIVTFLRWANFFPFLSPKIYDWVVNVNGVRSGGAIMSSVFNTLNYLTGFLFLFLLVNSLKSKKILKRIFLVLAFSTLLSLLFALVQKFHSIGLGNTSFWTQLHRLNGTFKDPNSLGAYLSALLPLLVVGFLYIQTRYKPAFLILIILALIIFPSSGSRSAFLALCVAMLTLLMMFLLVSKKEKNRQLYIAEVFLFLVVISLFAFVLSKQSNLSTRLGQSLNSLEAPSSLSTIFTGKVELWRVSLCMLKDFPLTGVGLGGFIIELPNYGRQMGFDVFGVYTDSAENYLLQAASELGLIGLFLFLWLFYKIAGEIRGSFKSGGAGSKDRLILLGLIAGLVSLSINSLFHSYIGSFEIQYLFWLLVTMALIWPEGAREFTSAPSSRKFKTLAVAVVALFGTVQVWTSARILSLERRTQMFGWDQNCGLYETEKDKRALSFHWAKKDAAITIHKSGDILVLPILASHPDIEIHPVNVKIFDVRPNLRKKNLIKEIVLKEKKWVDFEYPISKLQGDKIILLMETDRDWQPWKILAVPDNRRLAIALGEEWFKYPSQFPKEDIKKIKSYSSSNWEGKLKANLFANGFSQLKFRADEGKCILRLWAKGGKVYDVGPLIIIRLDGKVIGKTMLTEERWTPLFFQPEISAGDHILAVEFTNDLNNPKLGQDRNVFLGDLEVIYQN